MYVKNREREVGSRSIRWANLLICIFRYIDVKLLA